MIQTLFVCVCVSGGHVCLVIFVFISSAYVLKNAEAVFVVSKEIHLEVNAEKTKYMVMFRGKNIGQNSNP